LNFNFLKITILLTKTIQAMRTKNLLKLAFTMLAMIVMTGAMAQYSANIEGDYENETETIYQTVGFGLKLFVHPDPALHPDYVNTDNSGLNGVSEWRWTNTAWDLTANTQKDWSGENWVEIADTDLPTAGNTTTFFVAERFGPAGCVSATIQEKTVAGVAEPDVTGFAYAAVGGWTYNAVEDRYEICATTASGQINLTIAETGSDAGMQQYTYGIAVTKNVYDGNMDLDNTSNVSGSWGKNGELSSMTAAPHQFAITDITIDQIAGADMPTEYVFTFAANSLASTTTRVSDFRAGGDGTNAFVNNFTAATSISYMLLPTPTTGPIYHIPNNYAF
jgi:hypothetical protein